MHHTIKSGYLDCVFRVETRNKLIDKLVTLIEPIEFDAIVFTGISGSLVAPIVAFYLNKQMICLRRESDDGHYGKYNKIEGSSTVQSYIIIDDLIDSGNTMRSMLRRIQGSYEFFENRIPVCKHIFLYRSNCNTNSFNSIPVTSIPWSDHIDL